MTSQLLMVGVVGKERRRVERDKDRVDKRSRPRANGQIENCIAKRDPDPDKERPVEYCDPPLLLRGLRDNAEVPYLLPDAHCPDCMIVSPNSPEALIQTSPFAQWYDIVTPTRRGMNCQECKANLPEGAKQCPSCHTEVDALIGQSLLG